MSEKIKKAMVGFLIIVSIFSIGFFFGKIRAEEELEKKLEVFLQVLSLAKNDYVEKKLDDTKLIYGSIKGLLDSLDDPYSRFLEPKAYSEMKIRLKGSYSGIGIYIGMKDKQLAVIAPIAGTPGEKFGLKPMDKILEIDGKPTKDMALEEAVSMIRGKKGTKVKLLIMRPSFLKPQIFNVVRDKITINSAELKMLDGDIAYIKLITFEKQSAADEFKQCLFKAKDKKAKGLIVDVRNNGGGLLDNAIDIGSMFVRSGIIVQTVDRDGNRDIRNSSGNVLWWGPIVVLINEASASASEILAGALQDHKLATIVGTKSFGKASVQSVKVLQDESAVLLTIAKYQTPNGTDISKKGIHPDIVVEFPTEEAEAKKLDEQNKDPQLDKALEVVKTKI